jgi:hypothetical protein
VRKHGGNVIIEGVFINANRVVLYEGKLQFQHTAKQLDNAHNNSFELRGGHAEMLTSEPLRILGGVITGDGTVYGNLVLGYDPNLPGWHPSYPAIRPGIDGGVGTISVTLSYHVFASGASTQIVINQDRQASRVAVGGYAVLNGNLSVDNHPDARPTAGTAITVMTYGSVSGDFLNVLYTWPIWYIDGVEHWSAPEKQATAYVLKVFSGTPPPGGGGGG